MANRGQHQSIEELAQRLLALEKIVEEVLGVSISWTSLGRAATVLKVSSSWLRKQLEEAEEMRALDKHPQYKYGTHYRLIGSNWQVHVANMNVAINTPSDKR